MKKSILLCALQSSLALHAFSALAVESYPVELVGVNHTPMDFQIPQIKAHLGSNIGADGNVSRFMIQDEDQLKRVLSDFEQLLFLHKFESAIELFHAADYDDLLQSLQEESPEKNSVDQLNDSKFSTGGEASLMQSDGENLILSGDQDALGKQDQIDAQAAADAAAAAEKEAADKAAANLAAAEKEAADKAAADAAAAAEKAALKQAKKK